MTDAVTIAAGHSGTVHPRTGPALSDAALFALAALAVWWVRRRLRARGEARATPRRD